MFLPIFFSVAAYHVEPNLYRERCYRVDEDTWHYRGDRSCHDFGEPRRTSGIWLSEFEGSQFYPDIERLDDLPTTIPWEDGIWLSFDDQTVRTENFPKRRWEPDAYFRIDFIGRRAVRRAESNSGGFGHMGMFHELILVDEVLSIELLKEKSSQPNQMPEE